MKEILIKKLADIVGKGNILSGSDQLEQYSRNETPGNYVFIPDVVIKPNSAAQISLILKVANELKVSIVPRGAGTSRCGGSLPVTGGIVLSLEKMNKIKELDKENLLLTVEPGVITGEINRYLEPYNLFYPPDPASIDSCSIGGNVVTNAGGPRCLKYGVTRNYIMELEVVFPEGNIERLGGKVLKNVTGYNLMQLLIGSEGTLGIITEIVLRLLPRKKFFITLLVPFDILETATESVNTILSKGFLPVTMEFIDRDCSITMKENLNMEIPYEGSEAFLLIELEGNDKSRLESEYEHLGNELINMGAKDVFVAEERPQREKLWEYRRSIAEALEKKGEILPEDVVVPRSEIPKFITFVKDLGKKFSTEIYTFGHIGDGNIHIDILKGPNFEEYREEMLEQLFRGVNRYNGKISGEHGIGFTKKKYLHFSVSSYQIELMKRIKKVIDPNNILNPGKIFD